MKIRYSISALLICAALLCASCNGKSDVDGETEASAETTECVIETEAPKPTTNAELFDCVITKWQSGVAGELYEYAADEMKALLDEQSFALMFDSISEIGGRLNEVTEKTVLSENGVDTYIAILDFTNISAELSISFRELEICAFVRNVHFSDEFEIKHEGGVTERYFILQNDGCRLNAVYTYPDDGKTHPVVLLIAGSGPSDYNETIGLLTPFRDIALAMANDGVSTLRLDKRTLDHADTLSETGGIDEEYLSDCTAALAYLKEQDTDALYLLGHSLGGQIAAELALNDEDIDGMILFNSTPRHIADVMCDQYIAIDPDNSEVYKAYADTARSFDPSGANGSYYFGANGYYWASYNELDTINSIREAGIRTLIINSTYDNQIFKEDIELWKNAFEKDENVIINIYDDISHFGYRIDTKNSQLLYMKTDFPQELTDSFSDFCKQ